MITVLFFATYREITKKKRMVLDIPGEVSVSDFKKMMIGKFPEMKRGFENCVISIDQKFAKSSDIIPDNAEVAIFPQVSGGIDHRDSCNISRKKLNIQRLVNSLLDPSCGAISVFLGLVRRTSRKRPDTPTKELVYQVYSRMAEAKLFQICNEIHSKWALIGSIVIVQRIGRLDPGEIAVFIGCSSQHREDGIFEASRYAIDRLKQIVPIWKKEVREDGYAWIEGDYHPGGED